jgi:hypothetical protein
MLDRLNNYHKERKRNMKTRSFVVDEEMWAEFIKKHKSASARLRELIKMDLDDKISKEES